MGLRARLLGVMLLLLLVVQLGTFLVLEGVIGRLADGLGMGYARQYALANRALVQEPLAREIALARQMADSPVVRAWAKAERDSGVRDRALAEMESYRVRFLDRSWFYVVHASLRYHFDDETHTYGESRYAYTLEPTGDRDAWYFATLEQVRDYALNPNWDQVLDVWKVWINVVVRDTDGSPLGLAGTGIDLSEFVHRFVDSPDPGSQNIVLDRNLAIQAHHDRSLIDLQSLTKTSGERTTIARIVTEPEDLETLRAALGKLDQGESVTTFQVSIDGHRKLVGATYLAELDWYVLALLDVDLLIGSRFVPPLAILGVAALTVLALAVFWLVDRSVVAPVLTMTRAAQAMARGDYRPPAVSARRDEIGGLAQAFAEMAERIRINTETLETRVRERTAALDETNSRLAALNKALEQAATTDLQTGLLNRRGILTRLAQETDRVRRGVSTLCLMILDLDHFKEVNDRHGHEAGDRVLVAAANALKASVRSYDLCSRWGGEEFLVVSPGLDGDGATSLAEKLRQVIGHTQIPIPGGSLAVTISAGICMVDSGETLDQAISRADRALYTAKNTGRNRWVLADPPA